MSLESVLDEAISSSCQERARAAWQAGFQAWRILLFVIVVGDRRADSQDCFEDNHREVWTATGLLIITRKGAPMVGNRPVSCQARVRYMQKLRFFNSRSFLRLFFFVVPSLFFEELLMRPPSFFFNH